MLYCLNARTLNVKATTLLQAFIIFGRNARAHAHDERARARLFRMAHTNARTINVRSDNGGTQKTAYT